MIVQLALPLFFRGQILNMIGMRNRKMKLLNRFKPFYEKLKTVGLITVLITVEPF